jgi:hypothetical protein
MGRNSLSLVSLFGLALAVWVRCCPGALVGRVTLWLDGSGWKQWPRPARSVCDPEVLLGSVGPVLSRWPVLWSMACALVDGRWCGRWPGLWRRLVFRLVAGAESVAAGGSGGVTGAEPVAGAAGAGWPVFWPRPVGLFRVLVV